MQGNEARIHSYLPTISSDRTKVHIVESSLMIKDVDAPSGYAVTCPTTLRSVMGFYQIQYTASNELHMHSIGS